MNPILKSASSGGIAGLLVIGVVFAGDLGGLSTLALATQMAAIALPLFALKLVGIFAIGGIITGIFVPGKNRSRRVEPPHL